LLVVEVDGATHGTPEEIEHDRRRDAYMQAQGWTIFRVTNEAIYSDVAWAIEEIVRRLPLPSSRYARSHLPRKRGRIR
jgi:very-short-patch-repair endonuclease